MWIVFSCGRTVYFIGYNSPTGIHICSVLADKLALELVWFISVRRVRAIQQSPQFNTNLRMAKRADPFPDTCWEITLCKYVGLQISSYIHSQSPYSIPIYNPGRAVRALSNDTPGIEYDFFLWLMGGDTQGVSVGGAVHQRPEKPRSIQIWAPAGAAWSSLRVHTHPWRVLVFSPLCVCVYREFVWLFVSRFPSGISGLAQLTPIPQIRISLKFGLDQVRSKCHMCGDLRLLLIITPQYFTGAKMCL